LNGRKLALNHGNIRITQVTDEDLANDDTDNLHVADGGNPVLVASLARPAVLEGGIEESRVVTDGEQHVTIIMDCQLVSFSSLTVRAFN
jgi:hypothetical protein